MCKRIDLWAIEDIKMYYMDWLDGQADNIIVTPDMSRRIICK